MPATCVSVEYLCAGVEYLCVRDSTLCAVCLSPWPGIYISLQETATKVAKCQADVALKEMGQHKYC